ncbi:MAG: type 4a pilus biogenesis protein PilO [Egibacteraceae bacterium]
MSRRSPLLGLLACLLIGALFYFLAFQPRAAEQEAVEAETAQLQTQAQTLRNDIARLEDIKSNQVAIRTQLTRLEQLIPAGTAQPAVVRELQLAADAAGVEIDAITFAPPVPLEEAPPTGDEGTVLASVPITVVVRGGYYQAVDLFRRLEVDTERALLVRGFQMVEGEDAFPELSMTWLGDLFTVVPVCTPPPPPAPEPAPGEDGATEPAPEGVVPTDPAAAPTPTDPAPQAAAGGTS